MSDDKTIRPSRGVGALAGLVAALAMTLVLALLRLGLCVATAGRLHTPDSSAWWCEPTTGAEPCSPTRIR